MDATIIEWLNLGFRYFHVIAAIAWIGASFYFIWLDLSLREPPQHKKDAGVKGDLWAIHGGGIYEVAKYQLAPPQMPSKLHWFKWEAYTTWITGTCLLVVMYYLQASTYLIGHNSLITNPGDAIVASITFLVMGQLIYEVLMRTPLVNNGLAFAAVLVLVLTAASFLAAQLFSARAAYLHVGALIATWMAGNVFWGIMPAQRGLVAAIEKGETPDPIPAMFAKLRSTHNNYLTLPVIFCMISNHYPMVYGHPYAWLGLIAIGIALAWVRHYFNQKHIGNKQPWILATGIAALIAIAVTLSLTAASLRQTASSSIDATAKTPITTDVEQTVALSEADIPSADSPDPLLGLNQLVQVHCTNCHAQTPTQAGFVAPPAGLVFNTVDELAALKIKVLPALHSGYMPLGNLTNLKTEEREALVSWLEQH